MQDCVIVLHLQVINLLLGPDECGHTEDLCASQLWLPMDGDLTTTKGVPGPPLCPLFILFCDCDSG